MTRRDFLRTAAALGAAAGSGALLPSCAARGSSSRGSGAPDVIYHNGKIVTLDAAGTIASAVAIRDGLFAGVGSSDRMKALAGSGTRLVDLGGRTVVPGLIDAHTHPMETAMMVTTWVDCRYPGTPSVAAALRHIRDWITTRQVRPGAWVYAAGSSASQNKFAEKRLPTRAELDAVAPANPVAFANGMHMAVVNSAALRAMNIRTGQTKLPKGGAAQLDPATGEPTGVLTDAMADIPLSLTPETVAGFYRKDIQQIWNRYGFTSVMAITSDTAIPALQAVAGSGYRPAIRYTVSVWKGANAKDMPEDLSVFALPQGADRTRYRLAAIKLWVDGENDARTGYMYAPYVGSFPTDPPGNVGTLVSPEELCARFAAIADRNSVIPMMHVSGDRAMDMGLTTYENLVARGKTTPVLRLEHFGVFQLSDVQLERARKLARSGLRINVQPTWMLDLLQSNFDNMGPERAATGFRFRSMIAAGLEPAAGTDVTGIYPENVNPFLGIYAVVTRASDAPAHTPFLPGEAVSVADALRMWTIWAARSMGEGDVKGSIETGKYADMAVLSDDVLTMPPAGLRTVTTVMTIVGGEIVYSAA